MVKFISSEDIVGMPTVYKVSYLIKAFDDAYKSPKSMIILDNLERLVEYVEIGK